MSFNLNKANTLAAIIILVATSAISMSAQTPTSINGLKAKSEPIAATRQTPVVKKSGPFTEEDATAGPTEDPEINPRPDPDTTMATRVADEVGRATGGARSASPQPAATDGWQFELTPYLWIPTISGQAGIGNFVSNTTASVGDSDIELNFGFMGTLEARKDRFIIVTDLQYSDLATERGNPGPLFSSTRASFKTFVFDPEIGYRLLDNGNGATLDVLGGIRYWHLNATLAFRPGILPGVEVNRSRSWVDGVAGLRGRAALSQRWFLVGKADLGGGGSEFTYQLFGGVGVKIGKRFALIGGYRDLNVNYDKDGFLFDYSLHGLILGLGIRF